MASQITRLRRLSMACSKLGHRAGTGGDALSFRTVMPVPGAPTIWIRRLVTPLAVGSLLAAGLAPQTATAHCGTRAGGSGEHHEATHPPVSKHTPSEPASECPH